MRETSPPLGCLLHLADVFVTGTSSLPAERAAAAAAAAAATAAAAAAAAAGPGFPPDCHRQAPFPTACH